MNAVVDVWVLTEAPGKHLSDRLSGEFHPHPSGVARITLSLWRDIGTNLTNYAIQILVALGYPHEAPDLRDAVGVAVDDRQPRLERLCQLNGDRGT
jgi:hypothetical protein